MAMLEYVFRNNEVLWGLHRGKVMWPDSVLVRSLPVLVRNVQHIAWQNCSACIHEVPDQTYAPAGFGFQSLRSLFQVLPEQEFFHLGRAFQLLNWDRNHQFCSRCANPLEFHAGLAPFKRCAHCQSVHYPIIAPVVMGLVIRHHEILLARGPHFKPGVFSALAGFCEPGETLEQTLQREVHEEVGLEVNRLAYFSSQSWPFPHSLMVAFSCHYAKGELSLQAGEIEEAHWCAWHRLPELSSTISIARHLIDATVKRLSRKYPIP